MRVGSAHAQNIEHVEAAGAFALPPKRGLERAAREDGAVGGDVAQHDAFALTGEEHIMFAHDIAAANGGEADMAMLAGAGDAIATGVFCNIKVNAAPVRRCLTQHQGGAGGCVDLVVVMRLDHLDVEILIQCGSHLFGDLHQQVHPEAHVARLNDRRVAAGMGQGLMVAVIHAGGADHMHTAGLCSQLGVRDGGVGRGEVDYCLRIDDRVNRIGVNHHAGCCPAHAVAQIAPRPIVARAFRHRDQMRGVAVIDQLDQHLAHPARRPHYCNSGAALHGFDPLAKSCSCSNPPGPRVKALACGGRGDPISGGQRMMAMAKNKFHDGPGPSQRQLRVGELIRRTLSDVLMQGDIHDPELNAMSITVSEVRTSADLKIATVYVLPLGGGHRQEAIQALKRNKGELRRMITKKMNLKYAPDFRFLIDETFDKMDEARALFSQDKVRQDLDRVEDDDED